MRKLEDKVGIVTGGAGGLGKEICRTLVEHGAKVYSISRSLVRDKLDGVTYIQADVSDYDTIASLVDEIGQNEGLDFLVNNAGMTIKGRAETLTMQEFMQVQDVNVNAVYHLCIKAYPYLKKSKHIGKIVNISSMAAHMGFSEVVPYCVSKAAILGVTRGLAVEWRHDNMRVNSVAPGWFPSEMTKSVMDEQRHEKIINKIALGEFGNPKEVGKMVSFLISDEANYITGQDFAVDGGALTFGY